MKFGLAHVYLVTPKTELRDMTEHPGCDYMGSGCSQRLIEELGGTLIDLKAISSPENRTG